MKVLIIPDVHGRTFWKRAIDLIENYDKIIFLGDYLDPYQDEDMDYQDSIENFKDIINFKVENDEKVTLLLGNHDLCYFDIKVCNCRTMYEYYFDIQNIFFSYKDIFSISKIIEPNIIFSHAGFTDIFFEDITNLTGENDPIECVKLISDWFNDGIKNHYNKLLSLLSQIGPHRGGGPFSHGSCVWADVQELFSDKQQKLGDKFIQIFGHTRLLNNGEFLVNENKTKYCVDSRSLFDFNTETIELKPLNDGNNQ